jgi:hypothetical protein
MPRHRSQDFRRFLDTVETNVPTDLDLAAIIDNAWSHKTQPTRDGFAKRPRWQRRFTAASSSWINQVERFFALLTEQQITCSDHRSSAALEAAIAAYVETRNADRIGLAEQVISSSPTADLRTNDKRGPYVDGPRRGKVWRRRWVWSIAVIGLAHRAQR